jgi:hypothetical protein
MQRYYLEKLHYVEVKQYQVKIPNMFAALENFDDETNMIRT